MVTTLDLEIVTLFTEEVAEKNRMKEFNEFPISFVIHFSLTQLHRRQSLNCVSFVDAKLLNDVVKLL